MQSIGIVAVSSQQPMDVYARYYGVNSVYREVVLTDADWLTLTFKFKLSLHRDISLEL